MPKKTKEISQRELVLNRLRKNKQTGFKPTLRKKSEPSVPQYTYPNGVGSKNPTYH